MQLNFSENLANMMANMGTFDFTNSDVSFEPNDNITDVDAGFGGIIPNILLPIEEIQGTDAPDTLEGTDFLDDITGGAGNDELTGGAGSDYFFFDDASGQDVITDFNPAEGDALLLQVSGLRFEDVSAEQTANGLLVSWGDGNSVLLEGFEGELNENWLFTGIPTEGDIVDEGDIIDLGGLPAEDGDETDQSLEKDINVFEGTDSDDVIVGTNGADNINGGAGDDMLTGGEASDFFVINPGSGTDTITDFLPGEDILDLQGLGVQFEDLTISQIDNGTLIEAGESTIILEGVMSDDLSQADFLFDIFGVAPEVSPEINIINGTGGDDNIIGTEGFDDITGGTGNDVLTGGNGSDFFIFGENSGDDRVTDFNAAEDILDFRNQDISFEELVITQIDGGTLIEAGENSVVLEGVVDTLGPEHFLFDQFGQAPDLSLMM